MMAGGSRVPCFCGGHRSSAIAPAAGDGRCTASLMHAAARLGLDEHKLRQLIDGPELHVKVVVRVREVVQARVWDPVPNVHERAPLLHHPAGL